MKKTEKLKLNDLRASFVLLDAKESDKIKGGDGIPYDEFIMQLEGGCWAGGFVEGLGYVAPEVIVTGQAPGQIISVCDLQNEFNAWNNVSGISNLYGWLLGAGGNAAGLYGTLASSFATGIGGFLVGSIGQLLGLDSMASNANANTWNTAIAQLESLGYSCSGGSNVRIEFQCMPNTATICHVRIWDPTNGYLLTELMTY